MALLPFAWLALQRESRSLWWVVAVAVFGVSWLADTAALFGNPWLPAAVYPVSQAGILVALLASRKSAGLLIGLLVVAALVGIAWEGVTGPDVLLETVAAGIVVGLVWPRRDLGRLRIMLLVGFGGGWLVWLGYLFAPGWTSWGVYQGVRAVSLGLFCWASIRPQPTLRLV